MARNIVKLGALEAPKTAFLLCDIQETFRPHVKHFGEVVKVANKMYPKGLGHTTKDINVADAALVYEKTKFSMYTPELQEKLKKDVPELKSVVLFGIERFQTIGCFVGTSENVLFKLLKDKNNPAFKQISKLNVTPTPDEFGAKTLENKLH
ncbi:hypothetical protein MSG28_015095 [Choristoneura fumiferana]|uniref:Uncharacterized protein n=1 Tax=Choristoneura fumiferana TaxID=7141 RepID=A0ACC0KYW8_CHOFU|nr:hypothetical protein MSG28_015095 [Choristoneura fumiferana]